MTTAAQTPRILYSGTSGDGNLGPFPIQTDGIDWDFTDNSHIRVTRFSTALVASESGTLLIEGTDYDIASNEVTLTSPQTGLLTAERLLIERIEPRTQTLDLTSAAAVKSETLEARLDSVARQIQDLHVLADRNLKQHWTESTSIELPPASERALKLLGFDASGDPIAASADGSDGAAAQPADATLTALAGLSTTDGDIIEATGPDTFRLVKTRLATRSALAALTPSDVAENDLVNMLGYAAAGDGGGGRFRWISGDQTALVVFATDAVASVDTGANTISVTLSDSDAIFVTGQACLIDAADIGLSVNTKYYIRRIDDDTCSLHTTMADAYNNANLVSISALSGSPSLQRLVDSEQGVLVPLSTALDGSSGVFRRMVPSDHIARIEWFGAVEGSDCADAIQAAILYLQGQTATDTAALQNDPTAARLVQLLPGLMNCSRVVEVSQGRLTIAGHGKNSSTISATGSGLGAIKVSHPKAVSDTQRLQGFCLRDVSLRKASGSFTSTEVLLLIQLTKFISIENVDFYNGSRQCDIYAGQEPVHFNNCVFWQDAAGLVNAGSEQATLLRAMVLEVDTSGGSGTYDDSGTYYNSNSMWFLDNVEFRVRTDTTERCMTVEGIDGLYMNNCHWLGGVTQVAFDAKSTVVPTSNVKISDGFFDGQNGDTLRNIYVPPKTYSATHAAMLIELIDCKINDASTYNIQIDNPNCDELRIKGGLIDLSRGNASIALTNGPERFVSVRDVEFRYGNANNAAREPVFSFVYWTVGGDSTPHWFDFMGNTMYPLDYSLDDIMPRIIWQDDASTSLSNITVVAADNHLYNGSGSATVSEFIRNDLASGITELEFGNTLNGVPMDQQSHIADASTSHALNATFSDTEVEAALDALGTKINSLIAVVEANKLTALS